MKQVLRGARGARQAKYYIRRTSVNNKENFSYNTVKILKMLRGDIKGLPGVTRFWFKGKVRRLYCIGFL